MIKKILRTSLGRAGVYTCGHILIAAFVVKGIKEAKTKQVLEKHRARAKAKI